MRSFAYNVLNTELDSEQALKKEICGWWDDQWVGKNACYISMMTWMWHLDVATVVCHSSTEWQRQNNHCSLLSVPASLQFSEKPYLGWIRWIGGRAGWPASSSGLLHTHMHRHVHLYTHIHGTYFPIWDSHSRWQKWLVLTTVTWIWGLLPSTKGMVRPGHSVEASRKKWEHWRYLRGPATQSQINAQSFIFLWMAGLSFAFFLANFS